MKTFKDVKGRILGVIAQTPSSHLCVYIEDRQGHQYRILQFCWREPVKPTTKMETPKRLLDYKCNYNNWAGQLTWLI